MAIHVITVYRLEGEIQHLDVAREAEQWAEAWLDRDVEIGGVGIRGFPRPGLVLRRIRIRHRPGTREPLLAAARTLVLRAELFPLLFGTFRVGTIGTTGAELHLSDEPGGELLPALGQPPRRSPFPLSIRRLEVADGELTYRDRRGLHRLRAEGVRLDGSGEPTVGEWLMELDLGARQVIGRPPGPVPDVGPTTLDGRLKLRIADGSVTLLPSNLALGPAELEISGELGPLADTAGSAGRTVRLAARLSRLPLDDLPPLPGGGRMDGRAEGELVLRGYSTGPALDLSGRFRMSELSLAYPGGTVLRKGRARGRIRGDTVHLDSLQGQFLEGPGGISGHLRLVPGAPYRARFRGSPRVRALLRSLHPGALEGEGVVTTDLRAAGTLDSHALPEEIEGSVSPTDVRLAHPSAPLDVSVPAGTIEANGSEIRARALPLMWGRQPLAFTGRARGLLDLLRPAATDARSRSRPGIQGSLTGTALDLADLAAPGRPFPPRPARLPVDLDLAVRLDTLRMGGSQLRSLDARIRMGANLLAVGPARLEMWDGTLRPDVTLGLGAGDTTAFSVRLRLDTIRAASALEALLPRSSSPVLRGRLSGRFNASGEANRELEPSREVLAGSGVLELASGRLAANDVTRALADETGVAELRSLRIRSARARLRLSGTGVQLDSARVVGEGVEMRLDGLLAYDGRVDLAAALTLPRPRVDPAAPLWSDAPPGGLPPRRSEVEDRLALSLRIIREDGQVRIRLEEVRSAGPGSRPPGSPQARPFGHTFLPPRSAGPPPSSPAGH